MRELVTVMSCDICAKDLGIKTDRADDAPDIRVVVDGRALRLDVCDKHRNPSWLDIVTYAWPDELPPPTPTQSRQHTTPRTYSIACPICAQLRAHTTHGLNVHMQRMHGHVPLEERQRLAGMPVTRRNVNRHAGRPDPPKLTDRDSCPVCGKSPFHSYHGIVMHMTKAHSEIGKAQRDVMLTVSE